MNEFKMMRKLIFLLLMVSGIALTASAQSYGRDYRSGRRGPRARVEWGLLGGVNIPDYSTSDDFADAKNKLGWQLGIATAIDFGAWAIEPQIIYQHQGLKITSDGGETYRLKTNSIDVPVLFSLRMLRPVRFYAGPVFTVMNDCKRKNGGDLMDFGRLRPTVSAALGVGVAVTPRMVVDLRYNWQLRSKHNVVLPDGEVMHKLRMYSVAFNLIYSF